MWLSASWLRVIIARMAGDDLTICLFLVGLAASFLLGAMSQAGWKHRVLIACLFGVAAIFFVLGIIWPWIKDLSPVLRSVLVPIATSPVAWFCVVMLALAARLVVPPRLSERPVQAMPQPVGTTPNQPHPDGHPRINSVLLLETVNSLLSFAILSRVSEKAKVIIEATQGTDETESTILKQTREFDNFFEKAQEELTFTPFTSDFGMAAKTAGGTAETLVSRAAIPDGVNPFYFRRFFIAKYKLERISEFLEKRIEETGDDFVGQLGALRRLELSARQQFLRSGSSLYSKTEGR